ncbi:MAG: hypothetical protein GDA55_02760 [Cellvibrionales bacterium]|nr:hypothetical protein [Cellvibrionales bacterium]
MLITELAVLKWAHILAMVYWLGGEWGVFQTSYNVVNRKLAMDERKRHMETAYRIDILARTGILLLFPLGFHMGKFWGVHLWAGGQQSLIDLAIVLCWIFFGLWLVLCWAAFVYRETDRGIRLTRIDESIRFVFIPVTLLASISSLLGHGPFLGEPGWFAAKILVFSLLLIIGLKLRFIMREWTHMFRLLAQKEDAEVENTLERSIRIGRNLAYVYWVGIATVAFLGATKPF